MRILYTTAILLYYVLVKCASFFNPKARLWIGGRKRIFSEITTKIQLHDKVFWFHAASLGEYEQGLPLMQALHDAFPSHKIVVSFFSPSGYEVVKEKNTDYIISYLPIDTIGAMKKWIEILHPEKVFFIKYEYWYNALFLLKKNQIPVYFVSSLFRSNQVYFKWYGSWFRKHLSSVAHFFVQNKKSKELLKSIDISQSTVSGDTRFERVKSIEKQNNELPWLAAFSEGKKLLVAGSTWKADEQLLCNFITNYSGNSYKFVIVPHTIHSKNIQELQQNIPNSVLFSEIDTKMESFQNAKTIIVDSVGMLTKMYSYASIAYVGGAFGKEGVHNVLEPAVFGIPIVIGPVFHQFLEAKELVKMGGISVVNSYEEFEKTLLSLMQNNELAVQQGAINSEFVHSQPNSVSIILSELYS